MDLVLFLTAVFGGTFSVILILFGMISVIPSHGSSLLAVLLGVILFGLSYKCGGEFVKYYN